MINYDNIINRMERVDDVCASLRNRALGFDMSLDNFLDAFSDNEIDMYELINFSVEFAKNGYRIIEGYDVTSEKIIRYFCIIACMMVYLTFPKEYHTFTTLSYLSDMYDKNYQEFQAIANAIKSDTFHLYFNKLEEISEYLVVTIKDTFDILTICFIDSYTPESIMDEISNVIVNDISAYLENSSYDDLLISENIVDDKIIKVTFEDE